MKSPIHSSLGIVGCLLASGMVTLPLLAADETTGAPKSIFNLPTSSKEGRDPFFPNSMRPYEAAYIVNHTGTSALVLKGFSGPVDHRLVIINNHTFAEGDEEDVSTPGGRIRVRCVEIRGNSVLVEADGQRQELTFQASP
jgi:hypothetical protein